MSGDAFQLSTRDEVDSANSPTRPQVFAKQIANVARRAYVRAEIGDATADQERFFESGYSDTLRSMAVAVLNTQGPIRDDVLARELARAHGFARTGNKIKERVLQLLPNVIVTEEVVGKFLWPSSRAENVVQFRYSSDDKERRSLDEISMPELIGLVQEHPLLAANDDPALALAREIGLARLAQSARQRLEEALAAVEICSNRESHER